MIYQNVAVYIFWSCNQKQCSSSSKHLNPRIFFLQLIIPDNLSLCLVDTVYPQSSPITKKNLPRRLKMKCQWRMKIYLLIYTLEHVIFILFKHSRPQIWWLFPKVLEISQENDWIFTSIRRSLGIFCNFSNQLAIYL